MKTLKVSATMASMLKTLIQTPQNPLIHKLPRKFPLEKPPLFLSFSQRHFTKQVVCNTSENNDSSFEQYPRPSEIQFRKDISNSVQLIGKAGFPVKITHLSSGKVVGSTRLAVYKSATETSWINLSFWGELAHIAHQHVQKGNQIYVSGRLTSDTVESEDGKKQTYYQVTVQQLNFVEGSSSSPSPVPLYDDSYGSSAAAAKFNSSAPPTKLSNEDLWQAFFANPAEWWDNRKNKKNPRAPDFKQKTTGEVLWVDSWSSPPWVKSKLEVLDSKMESF